MSQTAGASGWLKSVDSRSTAITCQQLHGPLSTGVTAPWAARR
jgi:hypothetical protein